MPDVLHGLDEMIRLRQRWTRLMTGNSEAPLRDPAGTEATADRLTEVTAFGGNPGALRMLRFLPPDLPRGAPLVVALHGCTQSAAGFDHGCGWSDLAGQVGFGLLMPEQRRENNGNLCFNWFEPEDTRRDSGEALSIRQMIGWMLEHDGLDPRRVFIAGLSAGGAMTSVMLATYPEVFSGGAILAGLPYGAASTVPQAFEAMFQAPQRSAGERGDAVRAASRHQGPWPRVSVWQGEADATVRPGNAEEVLKQWLDLHGLEIGHPTLQEARPGETYRAWGRGEDRPLVEIHSIPAMEHGVPLHAGTGERRAGSAGPFLLDVGLSSPHAILDFWGLGEPPQRRFAVDRNGEAWEVHGFSPASLLDKALRIVGLR
ncbi:esterase [Roseomonas sp. KE0001]|nr:esterase [Roseomonas sp. KE0001]